jgi:hypothetical protein
MNHTPSMDPNQKKKWPLVATIFLTFILVNVAVYLVWQNIQLKKQLADAKSEVEEQIQPTPTSTLDPTADWETYTNEQYGFEIKVPEITNKEEINRLYSQYIRLQNYNYKDIDNSEGLSPEQFYLEITIYDHELNQKLSEPCQQLIENPKTINLGSVIGYIGNPSSDAGDPSKFVQVLCISKPGIDLYIRANEDHSIYADQILSTFEFLDEVEQGLKGGKVFCQEPRPELCTLECIVNPPYICGSGGKSYCTTCQVCSNLTVQWYTIQDQPCSL